MNGTPVPVRRRRPSGLAVTIAAVGALSVGVLTGCSSEDPSSEPPSKPAAPGAIPSYNPEKGARTDAVAGTCDKRDEGDWLFDGFVNNKGKDPRAYSIVVDFVTDEGSAVVDTKVVRVPGVQPGSSVDWSVTGGADRDGLRCIIRNVQFD